MYLVASFSVWILLSLSDGSVGMILRSCEKASLSDCVRWRSRTFAKTRWLSKSSVLAAAAAAAATRRDCCRYAFPDVADCRALVLPRPDRGLLRRDFDDADVTNWWHGPELTDTCPYCWLVMTASDVGQICSLVSVFDAMPPSASDEQS